MSKITAIIPSLIDVDHDYLQLCVTSLRESGFDGDIIVVSNGTKDMAPFRNMTGITKAITTKRQGQCFAVNQGAKMVEGDCKYLFVINSDMYFAPGWNKNIPTIEDMPLCWSPNLVEPTNNPGSADPFLKLGAGFTLDEFNKEEVDDFIPKMILEDENSLKEIGFNLPFFINIEVWRTIGGYDEFYDPWGSNSDTDLQTLINLAGVTPMRLRDVLVYHFSNKSGTFDGTHQEEWQRNFDYYTQKFGFNRDDLGSDVWYNKDIIPKGTEQVKFKADWIDKYKA